MSREILITIPDDFDFATLKLRRDSVSGEIEIEWKPLEEILRLSDRIVVMRDHRKIDERINDGVSVGDVLATIAAGVRTDEPVAAATSTTDRNVAS